MADNAIQGIKITITNAKGSTPRNSGALMWVSQDEIIGSIGGGRVESDAIKSARDLLQKSQSKDRSTIKLGPEIGQCCGGHVELEFSIAPRPKCAKPRLAIFGAGHIGSPLARLAEAINYEVQVFDNRPTIEIPNLFPYEHSPRPESQIANLQSGTSIIILTHDHALDFRVAETALLLDDLGQVGMIGSRSKAAQFRSQFGALGERLERLQCPIGTPNGDKRPESVALDILHWLQSQQLQNNFT